MAKVYILVGKIASGKTSWVKEQKKQKQMMLLSCDKMILELYDGCLGKNHGETERRCLLFLFGQAVELIGMGIDAALDSGFWTKESRKAAKDYFSEKGIETVTVYFKIPDEIRKKRLELRNSQLTGSATREFIIDMDLMEKLDKKFEEPSTAEIDEIIEK